MKICIALIATLFLSSCATMSTWYTAAMPVVKLDGGELYPPTYEEVVKGIYKDNASMCIIVGYLLRNPFVPDSRLPFSGERLHVVIPCVDYRVQSPFGYTGKYKDKNIAKDIGSNVQDISKIEFKYFDFWRGERMFRSKHFIPVNTKEIGIHLGPIYDYSPDLLRVLDLADVEIYWFPEKDKAVNDKNYIKIGKLKEDFFIHPDAKLIILPDHIHYGGFPYRIAKATVLTPFAVVSDIVITPYVIFSYAYALYKQ